MKREPIEVRPIELKPCQHCGKSPVWIRSYSKWRLQHECDVVRIIMSWGKKSELADKWNTRTESNALSTAVEALEAVIVSLKKYDSDYTIIDNCNEALEAIKGVDDEH
jgi:hypothetical protein